MEKRKEERQVNEPQKEEKERKHRFQLVRLEERIAPGYANTHGRPCFSLSCPPACR
jgi:hypothetical protein